MGCTASRENGISIRDRERLGNRRKLSKSSSFTPLRSSKPRDLHYDYHVVALTSSTYGLMKLLESEQVNEHLVSVIGGNGAVDEEQTGGYSKLRKSDTMPVRGKAPKTTWTDMAMATWKHSDSRFKLEQIRKSQIEAKFPLNPKEMEETVEPCETETINTWELMEGLDDRTPLASPLPTNPAPAVPPPKDLSCVGVLPKLSSMPSFTRSRSLNAVDGLWIMSKAGLPHPDHSIDSNSSVTQISTNQSFDFSNRGSMDFSSRWSMDFKGSMDLSSTGMPVDFPERCSGSLNNAGLQMDIAQHKSSREGLLPSGQVMGFPMQQDSGQSFQSTMFPTVSDGSHGDSNLFDPDILATFQSAANEEKSPTSYSDDDWCHVRHRSDGEASTSGSVADDDSSPIQWSRSKQQTVFNDTSSSICDGGRGDLHSGTYGSRRTRQSDSFAKVMPFDNFDDSHLRPRVNLDPLYKYEEKCPPGGDDRVVLYLTSLRGIRKTFEDCHSLRMILQSHSVWVDERDVSMHAEFRQELRDLLDGPVIVPRLFIKGRYIGGSDEVRKLHEDGKLSDLLRDFPVVQFRKACDGCGGVRFVPCPDCSGSCKIITAANEVARCPDCNENGLIRCPVCF
ncbi:uncharacterized protein [Physcomitrium patens]|uniref:Glutaredoxin domain-containing protein n=1 Tax=Physcomitrium patens TaxID=3218 RepID=A0A2K1JYT7_PHYPA|nr:uncharacterized protein LOC112287910 [Physcomitrium patens]PNR46698.1 hypothetical protein PHYPA_013818 [Physcomitrium patens]|eukprot:XP_024387297.1 uncharacterized protein LOC112287910 [Physcomitrella patens]